MPKLRTPQAYFQIALTKAELDDQRVDKFSNGVVTAIIALIAIIVIVLIKAHH